MWQSDLLWAIKCEWKWCVLLLGRSVCLENECSFFIHLPLAMINFKAIYQDGDVIRCRHLSLAESVLDINSEWEISLCNFKGEISGCFEHTITQLILTIIATLTNMFYFFFINLFIYLFYFCLCWVFIAARRLSLVVASGGYSSLRCASFSLWWLLLLWSTGSRHVGFSSCVSRAQ